MPLHLAKSWRSVYIDVFGNTSDLWTHEERGVRNQQLTSFSTLSTSKYCSNQTPHEESAQSDRNGSNDVFGGGGGVSAMLAVTSDHTWSATWLAAAGATPTAHNITNYRPTTSSSDVNCAYDFGLISINDSRQSADKSTLHALCHSNDLSQNDRRKSSGLCFGYWFMLNGLCFRRSPSPGAASRSAVA